jgi:phosphosulfolactate synthase
MRGFLPINEGRRRPNANVQFACRTKVPRRRFGSGCKSTFIRGNNSLTIAAALEDGHTAWSGPVHLDQNHDNSFAVRARQVSAIRFPAASGASERAEAAPAWLDDDDRSRTALRLYRGSRDHGGRLYLQRKIEIYKAHNIMPFIGGQFHEYVLATEGAKATVQFYDEAKRLGFAAIEISDNVVPLTDQERRDHIRAACDSGLVVFGEVGGKDRRSEPDELLSQARICLAAGARLVLVEAAELLVEGKPDRQMLSAIYRGLDPEQVMIELPGPWIPGVRSCDIEVLKKLLVTEFGPDVNIANVSFDTVLDLEATRNGLGVAGPFSARQLLEWAK